MRRAQRAITMTSADELKEQGVTLFNQHDYESASRLFHEALDAYKADEDADMVAEMYVNIGLTHSALGENQQALDYMQDALRHFQETKDELRTAQVLGNLGGVYSALEDKERAINAYRQASDVFLELGEDDFYAQTLLAVARLHFQSGKIFEGAMNYNIGLEALEERSFGQKITKTIMGVISRLGMLTGR